MSAQADAINRSIVRSVLTHRATVYGRTGGTGPFNLVLKTSLACRLEEVEGGRRAGATSAQRRELANLGTLRWDASYDFPTEPDPAFPNKRRYIAVQVTVDAYPGVIWNPVASTFWPDDVPGIGVVSRSCDVVRAL